MRFLQRLAAVLTIFIGLLNGWRAVAQLNQREVLAAYGASLPIGLLAFVSALWAIGMASSGIIAWRTPHRVRLLIPLLFLTYTLYNLWLPTDTFPYLYGHLFMLIFTAIALRAKNSEQLSVNSEQ